jgi:hypothetical protein
MLKTIQICLAASLALAGVQPAESQRPAPCLPKASRPPQQHSKTEGPDAQVSQRGTDSLPMVVRISPAQVEQLITSQQAQQHEQESSPDWWMIGLTGLLAVSTLGLWLATRKLVHGAEKTAERQLRAYITVKRCKTRLERRPSGGWGLAWVPQIINAGQTPAYDVRVCTMSDIRPDPLPPGTDLLKELEPGTGSRHTLGTGQSVWPLVYREMSDSELTDLKSRAKGTAFYLWGTAVCRDIFRMERTTEFCYVADWDIEGNPIARCAPQHNEAD